MLNGLTPDIKRFIDRLTYMETERELILKETLTFVASIRKQFNQKEIVELAKQKALEIANELIEEAVKF
ncbi:hypothetical protein [Desulfurobacterium crinifex]